MKKVLISGGAGFIGSSLVHSLYAQGYHEIVVLDNLSEQIHGKNALQDSSLYKSILDKVTFIKGCVTNTNDWETALDNVEVIVHLAAETGTGQSMYEIKKYVDVNIGGTALLLDILANRPHKVEKIVVASSRSIYGEGKYYSEDLGYVYPKHRDAEDMDALDFEVKFGNRSNLKLVATDEESKIHPSSVYGITKQNQEQLIMTVCPTIGIAPVAFRYQNVYGPGQSLSNPYTGILSIFSTLIKNNKGINIFEDGKESRDFIYIQDVVNATIKGIELEAANNEIFNVGSGIATDVITIAKKLNQLYKANVPLTISGNYRVGDIRHNFADINKIKSKLNFVTKVSFDEGIKYFVSWVNEQIVFDSSYDNSIEEMKRKGFFK